MKKRILLLVPCLLLLLGLLTACGGSVQTDQTAEQKLAGTTWSGEVKSDSDLNGLIDIDLPFDMGKLITLRFNSNGTGYMEFLNKTQNFTWNVNGKQVTLRFTGGSRERTLNFNFNGDSLTLQGTHINIRLNH